jgi:hypothetical protein
MNGHGLWIIEENAQHIEKMGWAKIKALMDK